MEKLNLKNGVTKLSARTLEKIRGGNDDIFGVPFPRLIPPVDPEDRFSTRAF